MYSSVALSTFTLSYNYHHPSLELFHLAVLKLCNHKTITPHFPFPQPLADIILISVSMNLTEFDYPSFHSTYK